MIVYGEQESIGMDIVMAYFNVLSWNENHENPVIEDIC
jgi:hypothetical protein